MCEEYETIHDRSERPDVMGQSMVFSVIKREVLLEMIQHIRIFLLQQYDERIERLSQQDSLSNFCMDVRFLSVVENGQYFMTEDTGH